MARISVHLQPGASRNEVSGIEDGVFRIKVRAPAVEGKANRALIDYLSDLLGIGRGRISIVHGETSRRKLVEIEGVDAEQARSGLAPATAKPRSPQLQLPLEPTKSH